MRSAAFRSRVPLAALLCASLALPLVSQADPPKLILQITVDQLRGDLPERVLDRLGKGGFRYLYDKGVYYADAHHSHAITETIVGHVTLSTGAYPSAHGMVGNVWYDHALGRLVYNIEDERYPLLSSDAGVDQKTEIDPTQKVAKVSGRSPANILTSTFTDELAIHTAGRAKIFGISVKDRAAVAMAGHAGKAFWFSKQSGSFVTSRFYYDDYPEWVKRFNESRPGDRFANQKWELSKEQGSYLFGDKDDQEWEVDLAGFGRVFPHPFGPSDGKYFTTLLTVSPAGDEITAEFAKAVIANEGLGQDEVTDYLSVSLSSTDYVGHFFGPGSLESEDNLLRLDRTLADLLEYVDDTVGLKHTLVVLAADHGAPDAQPYLRTLGIEAKSVAPDEWHDAPGMQALMKRFGVSKPLIRSYFHPYVYLDRELILEKGLDIAEVETAVGAEMMKIDGIAMAVSRSALMRGEVADTALNRTILRNLNVRRSGDIFCVFESHSFMNELDGVVAASVHGSPWRYDSYVPVIFAGAGLDDETIYRRIETVDIARTLSAFIGAKPPSGSVGRVLPEVAAQRRR